MQILVRPLRKILISAIQSVCRPLEDSAQISKLVVVDVSIYKRNSAVNAETFVLFDLFDEGWL